MTGRTDRRTRCSTIDTGEPMRADGSLGDGLRTIALVWIDALGYALVVALLTTAGALVAGIATGGGFVRAKVLLFLAGFLLMGYATVRLWPSSPGDLEEGTGVRSDITGESLVASEETRFQSLVRVLPPIRWLPPPPPTERVAPAGRLFLGSLFALLTSYLMETVLGIT